MHADRPLLSENATSSILHEIVHVALGRGANPGSDWIVEGLSEYYSLLVLRRSGTISAHRHQASLRELREWGQESDNLCARQSSGATTARAVSVFADVDAEIQRGTAKAASLDDVIRALAGSDSDITISSLRATARQVLGADVDSLAGDNLPGCEI
jgi:predicted metalloprotease with PDZ domain